jgi:hypothetical protein
MPSIGWTPRIVPYQTVYLVIDRFRGLGTVYRETEVERADLETNYRRPHVRPIQGSDPRCRLHTRSSIGRRTS